MSRFHRAVFSCLVVVAVLAPSAIGLSEVTEPKPDLLPSWAGETQMRGSIWIEGDDALTPENGVRRGAGTAEDPYVISNWTIATWKHAFAISIQNTSAHLVIENVFVPSYTAFVPALLGSLTDADATEATMTLENVSNVTTRNLWITNGPVGLLVTDAQDVALRSVTLGAPSGPPENLAWGLRVRDSEDIEVHGMHVESATVVLDLANVDRFLLTKSIFLGNPGQCLETPSWTQCHGTSRAMVKKADGFRVADSSFVDLEPCFRELGGKVSFTGNLFRGHRSGATMSVSDEAQELVVCGNRFEHIQDPAASRTAVALLLSGPARALVFGNDFRHNDEGLMVSQVSELRVENNTFEAHEGTALRISSATMAQVHKNGFVGNQEGLASFTGVDARSNWWGHPSGPSGDGPGHGDALTGHGHQILFEPWLKENPRNGLGCPFA